MASRGQRGRTAKGVQRDIPEQRAIQGLRVFQDSPVYQEQTDNRDREVFKDPSALKENPVLGVYPVPPVAVDCPDQEVRGDNLERKATKGHTVYQGLQDQEDRSDLLDRQGKKAKRACPVNLVIPARESPGSLVIRVLKVSQAQADPPDFQGNQDNPAPPASRDYPPHLPTFCRSSP